MTAREALREARDALSTNHCSEAPLEAEILLRQALGLSRVALYQELGRDLSDREDAAFRDLVRRRLAGEPVAYITSEREFYGLGFYVNRDVLIPRPETELIVTAGLGLAARRPLTTVADIGTGCGAIAIALALKLPQARIYATDVSADAIEVARINCRQHDVEGQVELLVGDLLKPLSQPVDVIVANLPYVKDADIPQLMPEIRDFEPMAALAGGVDGLDKVRLLLAQAKDHLLPQGSVMLEIGVGQAGAAVSLAKRHFPESEVDLLKDFASIERVLRILT